MIAKPAPRCTYRLQLTPDFGFARASALVPYFARLGISHLYLSPIMQAAPGSSHGYDVADPTRISADLGGEDGFRALAQAAHGAGLGILVDIVPNHVAANPATPMWHGLLQYGRQGPAGATFDVDWETPLPGAAGKVVLPVLGAPYGECLAAGELRIVDENGTRRLAYHEHRFPIRPDTPEGDVHAIVEAQHYRLVHWRAGATLVNYRRFFSINDLAGVRVEDPAVFDATHATLLRLLRDGLIDGLRVDHPDGLRDPARYLARLDAETGSIWTVAEKITAPGEAMRNWPVAGTTGYEFANEVLGLFVEPAAEARLAALDAALGGGRSAHAEEFAAKREVLFGELETDLRRLARLAWPVMCANLAQRDVGLGELTEALADLIAAMPVYRAYVDPETGEGTDEDRQVYAQALTVLGEEHERAALHAFLARLLAGDAGRDAATREFIARFHQLSSPAAAKGVEDTAFYRYRRLMALNEVGGAPGRLGISIEAFHTMQEVRARSGAAGLVATATHDTKRGEDTRLRMAALSELADWPDSAQALWAEHERSAGIDAGTAHMLFQTIAGAWPAEPQPDWAHFAQRIAAYGVKASREAKQATSWRDPNERFETALANFVTRLLTDAAARAPLAALAARCAKIGIVTGLAQLLLKLTVPGIPDIYQGTELWDLALVDPDNRRPVDFARRETLLNALENADAAALFAAPADGRIKAFVMAQALRVRRDHAECFAPGSPYRPLSAQGRFADHVVAFARGGDGGRATITIAPARPAALLPAQGAVWADTALDLPSGDWRCALSGQHVGSAQLADVLAVLPVALLTRAG